jgi:regulator of RNase E activity RraA
MVRRLRGAALGGRLTFVGWGEPIGCGGVAVFPNDIVVADQDGAVLIPQALLDHVLAEGRSRSGWKPGSSTR